jgi:hypothetical protein
MPRVLPSWGGNGPFLASIISEFDRFLAEKGHATTTLYDPDPEQVEERNASLYLGEVWLKQLPDALADRLCQALDELATHSYFRRI